MGQFGVGQALRRVEDVRFLTGRGRYTDDIRLAGAAVGTLLRSPHAHGEIRALECAAAHAAPGVLAVYTAADLTRDGIGDIRCLTPMPGKGGTRQVDPQHPVLARGRVRHVGDPVAGAVRILRYLIVDDFGALVNPMLAAGQVYGGTVQGIGQALLENTVYDSQSGQLLTGSFMDYCMPRADDFPEIELDLVEDFPCTTNDLGVKGAGEAGSIGASPAAINAVLDALKPLGVRHIDMPATPERVWRTIRDAERRNAA